MLDQIINLIEGIDGLEFNLKIAKESEIIIKGDFLKIAKIGAELIEVYGKKNSTLKDIHSLENELDELKIEA